MLPAAAVPSPISLFLARSASQPARPRSLSEDLSNRQDKSSSQKG